MASKKSVKKKESTWTCSICPTTAVPKMCEHLEELINDKKGPSFEGTNRRVNSRKIDEEYYTSGAGFVVPEGIKSGRWEGQFRTKLRKAGLSILQTDVLTCKFVYDESFTEIAKEMGLTSGSTAYNIYKGAMDHLKKTGFSK